MQAASTGSLRSLSILQNERGQQKQVQNAVFESLSLSLRVRLTLFLSRSFLLLVVQQLRITTTRIS